MLDSQNPLSRLVSWEAFIYRHASDTGISPFFRSITPVPSRPVLSARPIVPHLSQITKLPFPKYFSVLDPISSSLSIPFHPSSPTNPQLIGSSIPSPAKRPPAHRPPVERTGPGLARINRLPPMCACQTLQSTRYYISEVGDTSGKRREEPKMKINPSTGKTQNLPARSSASLEASVQNQGSPLSPAGYQDTPRGRTVEGYENKTAGFLLRRCHVPRREVFQQRTTNAFILV